MIEGTMIILSSPSGAGKTTLVKLLSERKGFVTSISHTPRTPRSNEVNKKDYHFVDDSIFNIMIDDIPYITCIQNNKGKHLIKKIPVDTGTNIFQSGIEAEMLNRYFFPITLNKLVIRFEDIYGRNK